MNKSRIYILFCGLLASGPFYAKQDTSKIVLLNEQAWELKAKDPDSAIILSTQALSLAKEQKWKNGEAKSFHQLGVYYFFKGQYDVSAEHYGKACKIWEEMIASGNKDRIREGRKGQGKTLSNLALLHKKKGEYKPALEYYQKILQTDTELKDSTEIIADLSNIGALYHIQGDYPTALTYFFKQLRMAEDRGLQKEIARSYVNIANCYSNQDILDKAIGYYVKALAITEKEELQELQMNVLFNIGTMYTRGGDYPMALGYYNKALVLSESLGQKYEQASALLGMGIAYFEMNENEKAFYHYMSSMEIIDQMGFKELKSDCGGNLGRLYLKRGDYKGAEILLKEALAIAKELEAIHLIRNWEKYLSELYEKTGRTTEAFEHYQNYIAARDTLNSQESQRQQMRTEMGYEFEQKEAVSKAEYLKEIEKQEAIADEKARKQKIITLSISGGLILVLVFAAFIFRSLRLTRIQKLLIEMQKDLVDEKQKEILDSIHYAKRIQDSLLTTETYIHKNLSRMNK